VLTNFLVTGGAGFVGSNLVKHLVKNNYKVTVFDKVDKVRAVRLKPIINNIAYEVLDVKSLENLKKRFDDFDAVAHFSASADIALGKSDTKIDFEEGIMTTFNVLEAMKESKCKKIIFPSSSTIYGNFTKIPTPEDAGLLFPTSLYGAAKLASEALISAYCSLFGIKSWIFRFGNVVGEDMTRGVIMDFIKKLKVNPHKLEILGDGNQEKDFIYVDDCVEAMMFAFNNSSETVNVFNLGTGMTTSVNKIANMVAKEMKLSKIEHTFTGGKSGWIGDAPLVLYDISKIKKLGWKPRLSSDEAVKLAIRNTLNNQLKI
jgi:UDP-glucose 4-epimerase